MNRHNVTYTVVYDSTGHVCEQFGGGWPTFIFLDRFMHYQDFRFFYPNQFDESYMCSTIERLLTRKIRLAQLIFDDSLGNGDRILNCGERADLSFEIENACIQPSLDNLKGRLGCGDVHVNVEKEFSIFSEIPVHGSGNNAQDPFVISLDLTSDPHYVVFELVVETEPSHEDTFSFALPVGNPNVLLVDDDGSMIYEEDYDACLYSADRVYHLWNMKSQGCSSLNLEDYETVIWFTGNERDSTLSSQEQHLLAQYLDEGGHLVISGQNIGYDLVTNGSADDSLFYVNYLHADYVGDSIEEAFLCGIQGDPISGEHAYLPIDEGQTSPSVIAPREGASPVLVYQLSRETAAIKYEGDHKLVYLALGFEGINAMNRDEDDMIRGSLMNNIIEWFQRIPTKGDINQDDEINVLDVLQAVNIILNVIESTPFQFWAADCNDDEIVNILDVVGIVNVVLGVGTCPPAGQSQLSPATLLFLKNLESYLSFDDFNKLMSLVKEMNIPTEYSLAQNVPNPFNSQTSIEYTLPCAERVELRVYDILGQEIEVLVEDRMGAGHHRVHWNASNMSSGIYFYCLTGGNFRISKRMVLIK